MKTVDIATIVTASHFHYALAMAASLQRFFPIRLHVLVVDASLAAQDSFGEYVRVYGLEDIRKTRAERTEAWQIIAKYADADVRRDLHRFAGSSDLLRWALKPVFTSFVLGTTDAVWYCDCDLYFCSPPECIRRALKTSDFILTPHHRPLNGGKFILNYLHGIFNAGFFAVTKRAQPILRWWGERCAENCSLEPSRGFFVDQRYLDVLPAYFPNVQVLRHRGCNVAEWNSAASRRSIRRGRIYLNGRFPLVFVHFSPWTIQDIEKGRDPLLRPILEEWRTALTQAETRVRSLPWSSPVTV